MADFIGEARERPQHPAFYAQRIAEGAAMPQILLNPIAHGAIRLHSSAVGQGKATCLNWVRFTLA